ncbi:MAG: hypothetical protein Q8K65_11365, partial [Alphaproteobacteria bacterium]|nr:hypothetical protein [Alphaproteobacteria bacterium]
GVVFMPKNDARLLFDKADEEWDAGNTKKAVKLFSMAAEQGDLSALVRLGFAYDLGLGVSKNKTKALQLYKRAARHGDEFAMSNIGTVYRDMGNFTRARFWFLKAFKSGDGDAALELAKLYLKRKARGDITRASKYLNLAISARFITEASVEEAELLLKRLKQQTTRARVGHKA